MQFQAAVQQKCMLRATLSNSSLPGQRMCKQMGHGPIVCRKPAPGQARKGPDYDVQSQQANCKLIHVDRMSARKKVFNIHSNQHHVSAVWSGWQGRVRAVQLYWCQNFVQPGGWVAHDAAEEGSSRAFLLWASRQSAQCLHSMETPS